MSMGSLCALMAVLLCFSETPPQREARDLFSHAERLQRCGKLEEAYVRFQEVHLLCPTSTYGEKAMERIHEIEVAYRNRTTPKPPFTILLGTVDYHH